MLLCLANAKVQTDFFHVSIEKDRAGFYFGRCKELPNAFTHAKNLGELKKRMREVIELILEDIEEEHFRNPEKIKVVA